MATHITLLVGNDSQDAKNVCNYHRYLTKDWSKEVYFLEIDRKKSTLKTINASAMWEQAKQKK